MEKSQYDQIAEKYLEVNSGPINRFAVVPAFLEMVGDVTGLAVLDMACGSGFFSRLLKSRGARRVVGVDISSRQISLARAESSPQEIEFRDRGAREAGREFGPEFDLVTGVFLLNYAGTEGELFAMVRAVHNVLKPGERFVGITHNPHFRFFDGVKYGRSFRRTREGEVRDGEKFFLEIYGPRAKICGFYCFHWSQSVYEAAFAAAGFEDLQWVSLRVAKEGYDQEGKDFWREFKKNPHLIGLSAMKP